MPRSQRALQLQTELDELQGQYASQGGGSSSTVNQYYQMMREGATEAGKTGYEKFLLQKNTASAIRGSQGPNRADVMLLKDGLDMSLHTMLDDSARMRTNLTELGLALGEGRRANIQDAIEHGPVPPHIAQQFVDQQRVLVEQRRLLEQLRQEKAQSETDQKWLKRDNSNRYHGWNCADPQNENAPVPVAPKALNEAHSMLRTIYSAQEGQSLYPPTEAIVPLDGHLLAEFLSIAGFSHKQLYNAHWEIRVSDKAGADVASGAAQGPRSKDGSINTRHLDLTIPGECMSSNLDVNLILTGDGGRAAVTVPLTEIDDVRGLPKTYTLEPLGGWAAGNPTLAIKASLCVVAPKDSAGHKLAQTRVQKHGVTGMSRSHYPGEELPTSQVFLRQQALDWQRAGCPIEVDTTLLLMDKKAFAPSRSGTTATTRTAAGAAPVPGGGIKVGGGASVPEPEPSEEDESESGEEPEPPASGSAFFAGYREEGDEPEPMPLPKSTPRTRRPRRDRWHAPNEVSGGSAASAWMPPQHHASRPIAAFGGFQESALSRPPAQRSKSQRTPNFAAFAGEQESTGGLFGGLFGGTSDESPKPRIQVNLRPPTSVKTMAELYAELRYAVEDGILGTADVAQDYLEFAARCAQAGVFERTPPEESDLSKYAGILIDGIDAYPGQPVLTMWGVDALISVFKVGGRLRSQLGVPIFSALARASYNFDTSDDLSEIHARLLAGLAATASPDCLASPKLVDYILDQLESKMAAMPPLTAEHALAVLCAIRSSHRLGTQIRHTLFLLRGFKSDPHLSTRMLVTLAELYEVMRDEVLREVGAPDVDAAHERAPQASGVDDVRTSVFDRGLPSDGTDIRLTSTVLDLYPNNRKVAGAAVRAFAAMSKLSAQHLQAVLVDELRGLASSQRRHSASRSVNLHCAEVVLEAAVRDPSLISKGAVLLVGSAQRAFPQDQEIVQNCVDVLRVLCDRAEHKGMLVEAVPAHELVKLGELHSQNPRIIEPVLHLFIIEAFDNARVRDELVRSSAVAVPLRALDFAWADAKITAKAMEAVKRLTFRSRDALRQCHRSEGIKVLWSALERHQRDPVVVREGLSAIAGVAKHPKARQQLVNIWQMESLDVLDQILHIATLTVGQDGDILAQAALAIGTLTSAEDEQVERELRAAIDVRGLLQQVIDTASYSLPVTSFIGSQVANDMCGLLFKAALPSELYSARVLTESGALATELPNFNTLADLPDPLEPRPQLQRKADAREQVGGGDSWDIFAPLRALGVGAQEQYGTEPPPDVPEAEIQGPDPDRQLGFFEGGSLF